MKPHLRYLVADVAGMEVWWPFYDEQSLPNVHRRMCYTYELSLAIWRVEDATRD